MFIKCTLFILTSEKNAYLLVKSVSCHLKSGKCLRCSKQSETLHRIAGKEFEPGYQTHDIIFFSLNSITLSKNMETFCVITTTGCGACFSLWNRARESNSMSHTSNNPICLFITMLWWLKAYKSSGFRTVKDINEPYS